MNQKQTGVFIAQKRKEKNLTQAQLAEKLSVSNKTVSKWENGVCMPDYTIIELLCKELDITIQELINGREIIAKEDQKSNDNAPLIFLLGRTQELRRQNRMILSLLLTIAGISLLSLSKAFLTSDTPEFFTGLNFGLSIGTILTGILFTLKNLKNKV